MNIENMVMLHYENKLVIGRYLYKNTDMITLSDALHITKDDCIKEKFIDTYQRKMYTWNNDIIKADKEFSFTIIKGKSSWACKKMYIYSDKDKILSVLDSYGLKELANYIRG